MRMACCHANYAALKKPFNSLRFLVKLHGWLLPLHTFFSALEIAVQTCIWHAAGSCGKVVDYWLPFPHTRRSFALEIAVQRGPLALKASDAGRDIPPALIPGSASQPLPLRPTPTAPPPNVQHPPLRRPHHPLHPLNLMFHHAPPLPRLNPLLLTLHQPIPQPPHTGL